jgi:hypothetical protein
VLKDGKQPNDPIKKGSEVWLLIDIVYPYNRWCALFESIEELRTWFESYCKEKEWVMKGNGNSVLQFLRFLDLLCVAYDGLLQASLPVFTPAQGYRCFYGDSGGIQETWRTTNPLRFTYRGLSKDRFARPNTLSSAISEDYKIDPTTVHSILTDNELLYVASDANNSVMLSTILTRKKYTHIDVVSVEMRV